MHINEKGKADAFPFSHCLLHGAISLPVNNNYYLL